MKRAAVAAAIALALPAGAQARGGLMRTTCYDLRGTAADGTYVYPGMVAHNFLPAGTRIYLTGHHGEVLRAFGRRRFTVHDTGPALADGHMDIWASGGCASWGVRTVRYRIGWPVRRDTIKVIRQGPRL